VTVLIIVVDNIIAIALFRSPWIADMLRPVVFASLLHLVRVNASQFYYDVKDSATILVTILLFIACYALIGVYIFRYSYQGFQNFSSFGQALFNMVILMTTANFPDIMLPAYYSNYWYMLFFVSYLIMGLYLLMHFLLANVFNQFKNRLERQAGELYSRTEKLLVVLFDRFDAGAKGYLTYEEGKAFCMYVLNLNLKRKKHLKILSKLLDEMEVKEFNCIEKISVIKFFMLKDGYARVNRMMTEAESSIVIKLNESEAFTRGNTI